METLEAIFSRRSVRAFLDEPVGDQVMETLIQAGAAAPSGSNAQTRLFISVCTPLRIAALRSLAPGIIGLPPAVIVLCLDHRGELRLEPNQLQGRELAMLYNDLGAALENILLAARDYGLGACPVGSFHPGGISTLLNLPAGVEPCLLVVVGKPKWVPPAPAKRKLDEIYFRERYEVRDGNR